MTDSAPNRTGGRVSPATVAVVQFDPQVGLEHGERNRTRALELAGQAAAEGATLIVLPELAATGYTFAGRLLPQPAHDRDGDLPAVVLEHQTILSAEIDVAAARSAPIWNVS